MITTTWAAVQSLDIFHRAIIEHLAERGDVKILEKEEAAPHQGATRTRPARRGV
jgi:hypothetical protein